MENQTHFFVHLLDVKQAIVGMTRPTTNQDYIFDYDKAVKDESQTLVNEMNVKNDRPSIL